jgi:hypothetical protein
MVKPGYIISLPERLLRALAAGLGGAVYEVSLLLLPGWVRRSRFYQATVARLLRIIVELVGGVPGTFPAEGMPVRQLAIRKAAGNAVELVSFVAVGWSPVWLLAAAADVAGGTQAYLRLLVEDLKSAGALSPDAEVDSVGELLTALEHSLGQAADTVDMPPMNLEDMRQSWRELQCNASQLPGPRRLARIYRDLQAVAHQERQSIYTTSSLIAVGAVRTGVKMGNLHVFDYYRQALDTIAARGLTSYIQDASDPYRRTVLHHLDPGNRTYTERLLQRQYTGQGSGRSDPSK